MDVRINGEPRSLESLSAAETQTALRQAVNEISLLYKKGNHVEAFYSQLVDKYPEIAGSLQHREITKNLDEHSAICERCLPERG